MVDGFPVLCTKTVAIGSASENFWKQTDERERQKPIATLERSSIFCASAITETGEGLSAV